MERAAIQMIPKDFPVSILYKSIAGRYRPVRVADGPITARYRFIKNASWIVSLLMIFKTIHLSCVMPLTSKCSRHWTLEFRIN